ncbi:serine/threonine-protein kinase pim-1-like [Clarias gariepinus]|uniref:serine/threonine-protein kinase pim-1-like n=1 Tax=Clarias gariepinus TaxID=13013 RepID=UPI00234D94DD|nr:serine/threonine-protein kinase pim-1-like [Clarias gariepinus]
MILREHKRSDKPLQQTRYYLKIAQRNTNCGRQLRDKVADSRDQRKGCQKKVQPKPQKRVKKRSINLEEENNPPRKRPKRQRTKAKSQPSNSPNQSAKECLDDVYEEGNLLGGGSFGQVFAGLRKADGLPVAIKYVSKQKLDEQLDMTGCGSVPIEVALMIIANKGPSCSKILQMLDWYDEPEQYIMILERPDPCKDLDEFCKEHGGSLPETLACNILLQLIDALKHCKRRAILHRDVKPENILIQTDTLEIKLFDFGCGDLIKDSYDYFGGTLLYTPPEWFTQEQYLAGPGTIWSVGVTLYRLVCGSLPFNSRRDIKKSHLFFTKTLSEECTNLIRWCLSPKAADRPTLEMVEAHDWFHQPGLALKLDRKQGRLH